MCVFKGNQSHVLVNPNPNLNLNQSLHHTNQMIYIVGSP